MLFLLTGATARELTAANYEKQKKFKGKI